MALNEYAQIAHQKFLAREREKLRTDKRLRDAAPDLLKALRAVAPFWTDADDTITQQIRAAIAKAEGTS